MTDLNLNGLTDAQLRLFAVRCVRRVQHLMTDPRSVAVLDIAERHANGKATDEELVAARFAGRDAAWVPNAAAWSAAWAVWAAEEDAAWAATAAEWAAKAVAWAAADAAAWDAARAAESAWNAEREAQAKILEQIRQETPR